MEKVNIVLVTTNDYEAIYFNGVLKDTESMFHISSFGEMLVGYSVESFTTKHVEQEVLEEKFGGDFPHYLELLEG